VGGKDQIRDPIPQQHPAGVMRESFRDPIEPECTRQHQICS
jgi:hypothetical protein